MNTAEDVQGLVENTKIYPHKQLKMCQGLLKKYPVVCHLQMLKRCLLKATLCRNWQFVQFGGPY